MTHWSQDADGDVFRRLAADKFDFDAVHDIDFNIAFVDWPPSPEFLAQLQRQYSDFRVFEKEDKSSGYVQFSIHAKLTYELVMFVQSGVSAMAAPYGGVCESWGVMQGE